MNKESNNVSWDENGLPYSNRFKDKYFCQEDGLAEGLHTFCGGNDLSSRFEKCSTEFVIGETGFGSGLNFLIAWDLFNQKSLPEAKLHYVSIEYYPLTKKELEQSLDLWPSLSIYKEKLLENYDVSNNLRSMQMERRVELTIIFLPVVQALFEMRNYIQHVDAWFLDGFAPAKNPEMWSADVFQGMQHVSNAGTTCATFTSAGDVRRGLSDVGFQMQRAPGFGRKRHMLKGVFQ